MDPSRKISSDHNHTSSLNDDTSSVSAIHQSGLPDSPGGDITTNVVTIVVPRCSSSSFASGAAGSTASPCAAAGEGTHSMTSQQISFSGGNNETASRRPDRPHLTPLVSDQTFLYGRNDTTAAISLQHQFSSALDTSTQPVHHSSSSNKENNMNIYQKRARDITEAAQNGTPLKKSKPNSQASDEVSSSAILVNDEIYFSNLVRPAQIAATHARETHLEMQVSANKANEELKTLETLQEWHDKEAKKTEQALISLVHDKNAEIDAIEEKYEPLIKSTEEEFAKAAAKTDEFMKRATTKQEEFERLVDLVQKTNETYALARRAKIRREFIARVGQGITVAIVAKELEVDARELRAIFDEKITTLEDLRSDFNLKNQEVIAQANYTKLKDRVCKPLKKGGHKMGDDLHNIVNQQQGKTNQKRSKNLKEMLFEIFFPGENHPELDDSGRPTRN